MNLNNKDKDKIRGYIEKQLRNIPDGSKVNLSKELLESLIFWEYSGIKFPIWIGQFLNKIDLSEISFETCFTECDYDSVFEFLIKNGLRDNEAEEISEYFDEDCVVDFSNTNINIDFSKMYFEGGILKNWNLSKLDLSKSKYEEYLLSASNCDFSNSGILGYRLDRHFSFMECVFDDCDFSLISVDISDFMKCGFYMSSFRNSGLRVFGYVYNDMVEDSIRDGRLYGCYINDRFVSKFNSSDDNDFIEGDSNPLVGIICDDIDKSVKRIRRK